MTFVSLKAELTWRWYSYSICWGNLNDPWSIDVLASCARCFKSPHHLPVSIRFHCALLPPCTGCIHVLIGILTPRCPAVFFLSFFLYEECWLSLFVQRLATGDYCIQCLFPNHTRSLDSLAFFLSCWWGNGYSGACLNIAVYWYEETMLRFAPISRICCMG